MYRPTNTTDAFWMTMQVKSINRKEAELVSILKNFGSVLIIGEDLDDERASFCCPPDVFVGKILALSGLSTVSNNLFFLLFERSNTVTCCLLRLF